MIFFARHQRRRVPLQTTPPAAEHTAPNPAARRMRAAETTPIPVSLTRPYAPQPTADPLTAPDVPITETAVVGHQIRVAPSPSRHRPGTRGTHRLAGPARRLPGPAPRPRARPVCEGHADRLRSHRHHQHA